MVEPNDGFREQLLQFEKSKYSFVRALSSCSLSKSMKIRDKSKIISNLTH